MCDPRAVRERLRALGDCGGRIRRALHDLAVEAHLRRQDAQTMIWRKRAARPMIRPPYRRAEALRPFPRRRTLRYDEDTQRKKPDDSYYQIFPDVHNIHHLLTESCRTNRTARATPSSPTTTSTLTRESVRSIGAGNPTAINAEGGNSTRSTVPLSTAVASAR